MINDVAISQRVTRSRTWVSTFLINTCHLTRTFAVTNALRSTVRWCPNELYRARTRWRIIDDLALRIRTARRWLARIYRFWNIFRFKIKIYKLLCVCASSIFSNHQKPTSWYTTYKRIASKYRRTGANWIMIQHLATSGYTTRTKARIAAFHVDASFVQCTISINYALGSAGWRISYESSYTRTYCLIIKILTSTIWTARRWVTWILNNGLICKSNYCRNRFRFKTSLSKLNFFATK